MKKWLVLALFICASADAQTASAIPTLTVASQGIGKSFVTGVPYELWSMKVTVEKKDLLVSDLPITIGTGKSVYGLTLLCDNVIVAVSVDTVLDGDNISARFTDPVFLAVGEHILTLKGQLSFDFEQAEEFVMWTIPSSWRVGSGPKFKGPVKCLPEEPVESPSITVRRGALLVSQNPDVMWHMATGNRVNEVVNAMDFRALYEDIMLPRLGIKLGEWAYPGDLYRVTVWDQNTQVGEAYFIGTSHHSVLVFPSPVRVLQGTTKTLVFRTDTAGISFVDSGRSGDIIQIDFDDDLPQNTLAFGFEDGMSVEVTGSTYCPGVLLVRSYPTFAAQPLPSTGLADGRLIAASVTADPAGIVGFGKFSFSFVGSGVGLITATLYAFTDPYFSQPVSGFDVGGLLAPPVIASSSEVGGNNVATFYTRNSVGLKPLEVPAGQTYYLLARGIFSYGPNAFLTTRLLTEESGAVMGTFAEEDPQSYGLWTPNSYGITGYGERLDLNGRNLNADWINFFGIPGLWPDGLIQFRAF